MRYHRACRECGRSGAYASFVTALYATLLGVGYVLCTVALVWAWRTRHQRRVWHNARHDTSKVAIVLELEERVRAMEQLTAATTDAR